MKSVPATATNKIKSTGKPVVIAKKKSKAVKLVKKNSAPAVVTGAAVQGPLDRLHGGVHATDIGLGVRKIEDSVFVDLVEHDKRYRAMIVEMMKHMLTPQNYDAMRASLTEKALDKMVMGILNYVPADERSSIKEAFGKPVDHSKISELADFNFDCINVLRKAAA